MLFLLKFSKVFLKFATCYLASIRTYHKRQKKIREDPRDTRRQIKNSTNRKYSHVSQKTKKIREDPRDTRRQENTITWKYYGISISKIGNKRKRCLCPDSVST